MFSTQFESCDARRAFPCFDEPNLKATFDFEIEIPDDQVALSNMTQKEVRPGSKEGLQVVSFHRTPKMSTYLLAWAVGDFEYVEDFTKREYNGKKLPVRVYTTKGLKEQGQFALKNAAQIVDYFSETFKIDYPLPKADLLAVHEFSHGAMENWGLVTYRTTAVLFDEAKSDQRYKNRVAYVVAHELAHQWFGNLVTMDWWNEVCIRSVMTGSLADCGSAVVERRLRYMGRLACSRSLLSRFVTISRPNKDQANHLDIEWNVWGQFVVRSISRGIYHLHR